MVPQQRHLLHILQQKQFLLNPNNISISPPLSSVLPIDPAFDEALELVVSVRGVPDGEDLQQQGLERWRVALLVDVAGVFAALSVKE